MEIQILDDASPAYRSLKPDQYTGSVYGVVPAKRGHAKPPGEWNSLEIRAQGSKVRVELNGSVIVEETDVATRTEALARHPGIRRRSGYIGLQSHESPCSSGTSGSRSFPDLPPGSFGSPTSGRLVLDRATHFFSQVALVIGRWNGYGTPNLVKNRPRPANPE